MIIRVQFCGPMNCSPPGSSVHGVIQARILEWVAISFSRGSSWPRDWTHVSCSSCIGKLIPYHWATWEAHMQIIHTHTHTHIYIHTHTYTSKEKFISGFPKRKNQGRNFNIKQYECRNFRGGPVAKTQCSQCNGPGQGTRSYMLQLTILHTAMKIQHSQIKKKYEYRWINCNRDILWHIMASCPNHSIANWWRNNENSDRLYFLGLQNHCRWWLQPWN